MIIRKIIKILKIKKTNIVIQFLIKIKKKIKIIDKNVISRITEFL